MVGLVLVTLAACKNEDMSPAVASSAPPETVGAAGTRSDVCRPCADELTVKAGTRGVAPVDFSKVILIKPVGGETCLLDYTPEDAIRGRAKAAVSFVSVPCSCECRDFPVEDDNEDAKDISDDAETF